jgi:hypothetical protein
MKPEKAQEAILIFEELLKEGIITQQDFQDKKRDILNLVERSNSVSSSSFQVCFVFFFPLRSGKCRLCSYLLLGVG